MQAQRCTHFLETKYATGGGWIEQGVTVRYGDGRRQQLP